MASLVGAFAASHGPLIARDWHLLNVPLKARLAGAFRAIGARLDEAAADVLVMVSPDHWCNFFIDNLPSVCIGVGETHQGPPEPFLKNFPHTTMAGHPGFARHLLARALDRDFEPSLSHRLKLDHGFCIPILRMELARLPAIVPVIVNDLEPPMPSVRRCLAWGRLIREAIDSCPEALRVAVLATGGLSHSIGEPSMGAIDEAFDRACLASFATDDDDRLARFLDARMDAAGNGTHEVRNWVVAHAAAGGTGFEVIDYFPAPELYVGCGFARWRLDGPDQRSGTPARLRPS